MTSSNGTIIRHSSALNRIRTQFWMSELLALYGLTLRATDNLLGGVESSGLAYKWKSGRAGARKRSVEKIAEAHLGSERAFHLPLFTALDMRSSKGKLKRLVAEVDVRTNHSGDEILNGFDRYECLNRLARQIAITRLEVSQNILRPDTLKELAFTLRCAITCHDWIASNFNSLVPFLDEATSAPTGVGPSVNWDRVYILAVDDWLFFNGIQAEAPAIHVFYMDRIRSRGTEFILTMNTEDY